MKKIAVSLVFLLVAAGGIWGVLAQREQSEQPIPSQVTNNVGTVFAYQGRLNDDNQPANGPYDMEFRLFEAESDGNPVGNLVTMANVAVNGGLFNVDLDFGVNVFTGETRYLEIAVRPGNNTGSYETLTPRVAIRPVPYTQHAGSAYALATEMLPPAVITATATTGGFLTSGTYYFKVVASDGVGTTVGSAEASCIINGSSTNRCALSWQAVTGAAVYRIYKGATSNEQDRYQAVTTNAYNYDTDNGATLGDVPTITTAFVNNLSPSGNSWLLGGNLGIGTTNPEAPLHFYGNRFTLYGPNSPWGVYLKVGGTAWDPNQASVIATNGDLHLDTKDGPYSVYINYFSQNNTLINRSGGSVGIGTDAPTEKLTVGGNIKATGTICDGTGACVSLVAEQQSQIETLQSQVASLQEQQAQMGDLQQQNKQLTAELAAIRAQLAALETPSKPSLLSIPDFGFVLLLVVGMGVAGWQKRK